MLHARYQYIQASGSWEEEFSIILQYKPTENYAPLEHGRLLSQWLHLNKVESSIPKDVPCYI